MIIKTIARFSSIIYEEVKIFKYLTIQASVNQSPKAERLEILNQTKRTPNKARSTNAVTFARQPHQNKIPATIKYFQ
ncbi:hypothetical protein IJM86_03175 [bacterium]|nr:hypothetical protein [bacterium]